MTKANTENYFESREEASVAAAREIAKCLSGRLNLQKRASLVVTGGSSPARCYEELSELPLDWKRTHIVLSDERWVPSDDDDSNERLVRHTLLQREAAEAMLLPVFHSTRSIEARCDEIDKEIRDLPFPFACTLLGMGEDGHIASLFPDAANLNEGLDVDNEQTGSYVVAVDAVGAGVGEVVLYASGSSARQTQMTKDRPCDAVIMAIVDMWDVGGDTKYHKGREATGG